MKICWQIVSVHNSRDFLQSFISLSTQCQGNNTIPWHLLLFVSLRAATVRLPFLNIGMHAILWCWKGLSPSRVLRASPRALFRSKATHSSQGTLCTVRVNNIGRGCHGYGDKQCCPNSFEPPCDYLQRGRAPDAQFGQRSGRGRWAGCHPWRCQWRGSLASPLNYKHECINNKSCYRK